MRPLLLTQGVSLQTIQQQGHVHCLQIAFRVTPAARGCPSLIRRDLAIQRFVHPITRVHMLPRRLSDESLAERRPPGYECPHAICYGATGERDGSTALRSAAIGSTFAKTLGQARFQAHAESAMHIHPCSKKQSVFDV